jgi:hypothetical protein
MHLQPDAIRVRVGTRLYVVDWGHQVCYVSQGYGLAFYEIDWLFLVSLGEIQKISKLLPMVHAVWRLLEYLRLLGIDRRMDGKSTLRPW